MARVTGLGGVLGISILKGPDTEFNGIFSWILDPEGNKSSSGNLPRSARRRC